MSQLSLFGSPAEKKAPAPTWTELPFLAVDTETTGLSAEKCNVIEIAWVLFENGKEVSSSSKLCSIGKPIPKEIVQITGITDEDLDGQPSFSEHIDAFSEACSKASYLVAYNAKFDKGFIAEEFKRAGRDLPELQWADPCVYIKEIDRYKKGKKLVQAAARWGISLEGAHRALADTRATGELMVKLMPHLKVSSLEELLAMQEDWAIEQEKQFQAYRARFADDR